MIMNILEQQEAEVQQKNEENATRPVINTKHLAKQSLLVEKQHERKGCRKNKN